jgi:hypothetical protein
MRLGTQLRNRIHAVAADHGYDRAASYWTFVLAAQRLRALTH